MKLQRLLVPGLVLSTLAGLALGGYATRTTWLRWFRHSVSATAPKSSSEGEAGLGPDSVLISDLAQANLGLVSRPLEPQTYWQTITVPGMVVDRPGRSDRTIVSPVTGVVAKVNHYPGDMIRSGEELFTIKLLSESLHATQADLYKAAQEVKLLETQRQRLAKAGGAVPEARLVEIDNQISRLQVASKAHSQDLRNRGLSAEQINAVATGQFVNHITILAPPLAADAVPLSTGLPLSATGEPSAINPPAFEIQELKAELGEQVQVGQTLCLLANHQLLAIEGRAFRDEVPLLERSMREDWPIEVDFQESTAVDWPPFDRLFPIRHIANTIDPIQRTFTFLMLLKNQSRVVQQEGRTQMLWRFRPGQRVRLLVRVERLDNVFVLPTEAVARDGPEAFVFTQNVNIFTRHPVHVLRRDRTHAVVANDGSLLPGAYVAQGSAAQLNRILKSGSGGVPRGYHIHADGSLHKNEDDHD